MRTHSTGRALAAMTVAGILAITGCGDDSDSSSDTTGDTVATVADTSADTSPPATEPDDTSPPSTEPDDTVTETTAGSALGPIKYMVISTFQSPNFGFPEIEPLWAARTAAINGAGGIGGRQVEVEYCNDKGDANEASACARKAVDDDVVGVSGPFTLYGDQILSVLEPAGIPYIGGSVLAATDSTSPVAFPVGGGVFVLGLAVGQQAAEAGCTTATGVGTQNAAGTTYLQAAQQAFELGGGTWLGEVQADPGSVPDYAPVVATLLKDDPDCMFPLVSPTEQAKLLAAVAQSGSDVQLVAGLSSLPEAVVAALPAEQTDGIILVSQVASGNDTELPEIEEMIAEATAAGVSDENLGGSFTVAAWATAKLVYNQMAAIDGDVTAESLLAQMGTLTDPATELFGGTFSMTTESKLPDRNRSFNFNVFTYEVTGQQITLTGRTDLTSLADEVAGS